MVERSTFNSRYKKTHLELVHLNGGGFSQPGPGPGRHPPPHADGIPVLGFTCYILSAQEPHVASSTCSNSTKAEDAIVTDSAISCSAEKNTQPIPKIFSSHRLLGEAVGT